MSKQKNNVILLPKFTVFCQKFKTCWGALIWSVCTKTVSALSNWQQSVVIWCYKISQIKKTREIALCHTLKRRFNEKTRHKKVGYKFFLFRLWHCCPVRALVFRQDTVFEFGFWVAASTEIASLKPLKILTF